MFANTERRAQRAERETVDRYLALYLNERTGQRFPGRITGVTRFGLFVSLDEGGADGLVYSAQVEPDTQIDAAFRTDGYVTEIANRPGVEDGKLRLLQTGDTVSKGEVLARIETEEYDDKVATAQANLDKAKAMTHKADQDYKRAVALRKTNSITGCRMVWYPGCWKTTGRNTGLSPGQPGVGCGPGSCRQWPSSVG